MFNKIYKTFFKDWKIYHVFIPWWYIHAYTKLQNHIHKNCDENKLCAALSRRLLWQVGEHDLQSPVKTVNIDIWICEAIGKLTGWWLNQPIWKILIRMGILPIFRNENRRLLSCHHPEIGKTTFLLGGFCSWQIFGGFPLLVCREGHILFCHTNTKVRPIFREKSYFFTKGTSPKTNMDTQNDGLEKVDSFNIWPFLVSMISMLDFSGVHTLRVAFQMVVVVVVVVVVVPSDPSFARIFHT